MLNAQSTNNKPYTIDVRPLTGALGCEIYGLDVNNLTDDQFEQIQQAFLDYSVIMFHDQTLSQEQFAEFGKRFSQLEEEPFLPNKTDVPGVYFFKGAPKGGKSLSTQKLGWHADHTYQENPSLGAMLYAVDVPAAGGDTLFASNYLSYDGLSPAMQTFLEDKVAIHDVLAYGLRSGLNSLVTPEGIERLLAMRRARPQVEHPLVCKHPDTGRKMLYLNSGWTIGIKGLEQEESDAILTMLKQFSLKDIYRCRVRYQNKSLLLWDNRAVQHSPNSDYTEQRSMWRLALHSDWKPGS
jgi:taurine dioxygenase